MTAKVVIVEDEGIVAFNIQQRLQSLGYNVLAVVDSGEEAVLQVGALQPDLVLMDIRLAGEMDGVVAAQAIREQHDLPVVYLTAYTDELTLERAKVTEPYGYIVKPFDARELHTAIIMALYKHLRDRQARLLWERQKVQVLAEMASGLGHDFSDLLTVILGSTSVALEDLAPDAALRPFIELVETAARRAVWLTQQMFAYAGEGRLLVQPMDLNELVERVLAHNPAPGVQVIRRFGGTIPSLIIDGDQIGQVLRIVIVNAAEALGEPGGAITITTDVRELDAAFIAATLLAPDLPPGSYAAIEISDNGVGMSRQVLARAFEPFFTTKLAGRGLGLAVALGIVRSHHGLIAVDSEPGRGTSVTIFLPTAGYPGARFDSKAQDGYNTPL